MSLRLVAKYLAKNVDHWVRLDVADSLELGAEMAHGVAESEFGAVNGAASELVGLQKRQGRPKGPLSSWLEKLETDKALLVFVDGTKLKLSNKLSAVET